MRGCGWRGRQAYTGRSRLPCISNSRFGGLLAVCFFPHRTLGLGRYSHAEVSAAPSGRPKCWDTTAASRARHQGPTHRPSPPNLSHPSDPPTQSNLMSQATPNHPQHSLHPSPSPPSAPPRSLLPAQPTPFPASQKQMYAQPLHPTAPVPTGTGGTPHPACRALPSTPARAPPPHVRSPGSRPNAGCPDRRGQPGTAPGGRRAPHPVESASREPYPRTLSSREGSVPVGCQSAEC